MASIKITGSPMSAEVARVLACLFEKEVDFQFIRIDGYKIQPRKPEQIKIRSVAFDGKAKTHKYLKLKPFNQAITFEAAGTSLTESRSICRYLSETYQGQGNIELLGNKGVIQEPLEIEKDGFDKPSSDLLFHLGFAPFEGLKPVEEEIKLSKKKLEDVLDGYEEKLNNSTFLAGEKFTLADLYHLPNIHQLMKTECAAMFGVRRNVKKWWEVISSRPSWERVVKIQQEAPPPLPEA